MYTFDDVSRYHHGLMTADEAAEFEKALQTSSDLQAELNLYTQLGSAVREETQTARFRSILRDIATPPLSGASPLSAAAPSFNPLKPQRSWLLPAAIAAFLLSVVGILFWLNVDSGLDNNAIFTKYHDEFKADICNGTMAAAEQNTVQKATNAICEGKSTEAHLLVENDKSEKARIIYAECLIAQSDYQKAISLLENNDALDAKWLQVLLLIKVNKIAEAKRILIGDELHKSLYDQKAHEITNLLKQL